MDPSIRGSPAEILRLRGRFIEALRKMPFPPGLVSIEPGKRPDEIVFHGTEENGAVPLVQKGRFICLKMPNGKLYGIPREFLSS